MNFKLAFKNIFRHKTRTLITLAAIAFGCVTLILVGGLMEDMLYQLREAMIESSLGHLQIYKKGYFEQGIARPFDFTIPRPEEVISLVASVPHVRCATPRVRFFGLLSTGETTVAFFGEGVDPAKERGISTGLTILSGSDLAETDKDQVILGGGLAKALLAKVGTPLIVLANTKQGAMNALDVAVKGTFGTGATELDDMAIRMPISVAQKLLHAPDVHVVIALLDKTENTDLVREKLTQLFKQKGLDLEVKPWYEMADFYMKSRRFLDRQFLILKIIISIVVILGVFNTMNMSVLERIGEIGTIMALGYKRRDVVRLFLTEGLVLGLLGGMLGLFGGYLLGWLLSAVGIPCRPAPGRSLATTARVMIVPGMSVFAFVLSVLTALFSSVYPAFKAARLEIAEALRQNI